MSRGKMIYWGSTGLLSLWMFATAIMYFLINEQIAAVFTALGYPTYLIYPLAVLKILGVMAILTKKSSFFKNLAYAGFLFEFLLAASAHLNVRDGGHVPALVALALLSISYVYDRKLYPET